MSSDLRNKMYHFKVTPPATAWEHIDAALNDATPSYPHKLYHYQQEPPAGAWDAISRALDPAQQKAVIKVMPRSRRWYRYTALAAALMAAAFGLTYFLAAHQPAESRKQAQEGQQPPATSTTPTGTPPPFSPAAGPATVALPAAPAQEQTTHRRLTKIIRARIAAAPLLSRRPALGQKLPALPADKAPIETAEAVNRYMIATNTTGQPVRLPKKVYSSFACPDGSVTADYDPCREKIHSLQNKMSAAMATDFAGFLDLLVNLQEN